MPVLIKTTYIYMFTTTVTFAIYCWWIFSIAGIGYFTGPDALTRIGQAISILIVCSYAFEFFVLFVAGLFSVKVLKNPLREFTLDERDRQIGYKSIISSHLTLCAGLFLSVFALALGVEAFWVLNAIVLAFYLSVVAELATKFFLFKAGT